MSKDLSHIPVLVPKGKDGTDLTMGELDVASFNLGCDVLEAIGGEPHPKRYAGFIEIAWLWAKREDRSAKRDTFRDYEPDELFHALRMDEEKRPDPTTPGGSTAEQSDSSSPESSDSTPTTSTD